MKLLYILLLALPFSGIAQTDLTNSQENNTLSQQDVDTYIVGTQLVINACNKHFISENKPVDNDNLNAEKLQSYSKELLESGNYSDALICNHQARMIALTVLTNLTDTDYASHYAHFNNEKPNYIEIDNDTTSEAYWLQKAN